jgi:gamma-glutamylcyclotransferase
LNGILEVKKHRYFAYGSNLDRSQLIDRVGKVDVLGKGILKDHKLTFDIFSSRWGGGVADIVQFLGSIVYGAIYILTDEQLKKLDEYEGVPNVYQRFNVRVLTETEDLVDAITYSVVNKQEFIRPSPTYLERIIKGLISHGYEENVVRQIQNIATAKEE